MGAPRASWLIQGRIATLAGRRGLGWVEAVAVGEGRVLAAGRLADVEPLAGPGTRRLRPGAAWIVLPALTDAHLHLVDAALDEARLALPPQLSRADALAAVAAEHQRRQREGDQTGWLLGHGWSFDGFGGWPSAADLESVARGRPVALWAHDHHARWFSPEAMRLAGITSTTPDPPGGRLLRDAHGVPTGVSLEHAGRLVDPVIPPPDPEAIATALASYARRLFSLGLVGCHDPGEVTPEPALERGPVLYARLAQEGTLPLRVHASVREEQLERAIALGLRSGTVARPAVPDDLAAVRHAARAHMGWLKLFADGSLGSRTAAVLRPYLDTGGRGELLLEPAELRKLLTRAAAAGIAPQVHAIGDRAARVVLDALEAVPAARALPLQARIEHAQLVAAPDVARFGELGVAASVQPCHLIGDGPTAQAAWGDRLADAYRWRSLAATGVPLAFGTDAPVEDPDPWPGIAAGVTRRSDPARAPLPGRERVTLARALRAAILDPVLTAGEAGQAGRLLPGHRADLTVVPAVAPNEPPRLRGALADAPAALTMLDGEEVWRAPDFDA